MRSGSIWLGLAILSAAVAWMAIGFALLLLSTGIWVFATFVYLSLLFAVVPLAIAVLGVTVASWPPRPLGELPWLVWVVWMATLLPFAGIPAGALERWVAPGEHQIALVAALVIAWLGTLLMLSLHVARGGRVACVSLGVPVVGVVAVAATWWRADPVVTLHEAAEKFSPAVVRVLLVDGRSPDPVRPLDGQTPLMTAGRLGRIDIVRVLLAYRADPAHVDANGWSVLLHSLHHPEIARLLLAAGAPPDAGAVTWAAAFGDPSYIAMLREAGADVSTTDALKAAARAGRIETVAMMLDEGVPPAGLHEAAKAGRLEVVRLLLARGASANPTSGPCWSLLAAAVQGPKDGRIAMMEVLAAAGAPVDHEALVEASRYDDDAALEWLLAHGAPREPGPEFGDCWMPGSR